MFESVFDDLVYVSIVVRLRMGLIHAQVILFPVGLLELHCRSGAEPAHVGAEVLEGSVRVLRYLSGKESRVDSCIKTARAVSAESRASAQ